MNKIANIKSERTFGIEIEFVMSNGVNRQTIADAILRDRKCRNAGVDTEVREWRRDREFVIWELSTDSTCGGEMVSPILQGKNGMKQAKAILDLMDRMDGVDVNVDCGIHVHVGLVKDGELASAKQVGNLCKFWLKNEDIVNTIVAPSRRSKNGINVERTGIKARWAKSMLYNRDLGGRYGGMVARNEITDIKKLCKLVDKQVATYNTIESLLDIWNDRYISLNLRSYIDKRTVEFRIHGGSLSPVKVLNWTVALTNIVDKCFAKNNITSTVADEQKRFKHMFGTSKVVESFMRARANKFGFTQFNESVTSVAHVELGLGMRLNKMSDGSFVVVSSNNGIALENTKDCLLEVLTASRQLTTRQLGNMAMRQFA